MRVKALKDFTLAGEDHAKGEVFEVEEMRGQAWITAKFVEEMPDEEAETLEDDPKVKRAIDEEDDD